MGAPKQKWTAEEEAALRAGIAKYGLGKWSTILKDSELSLILHSRSNVDLKDKWRNINVMVNGSGSRQRGRNGFNSTTQIQRIEENGTYTRLAIENSIDIDEIKPLSEIPAPPMLMPPKKPISRMDNVILEAINELKEPCGSSLAAIALYIEERYAAPSNIGELLERNLSHLTEFGRLVKVKHQYKPASSSTSSDIMENPISSLLVGEKKDSSRADNSVGKTLTKAQAAEIEIFRSMTVREAAAAGKILTKAQVDADLEIMRSMTVMEAVEAAARAVAEAQHAVAEVEKATIEAEEAEAAAEAAECFAEAAMRAVRPRIQRAWQEPLQRHCGMLLNFFARYEAAVSPAYASNLMEKSQLYKWCEVVKYEEFH